MSPLHRFAVAVRRLLVRRPWVYWLLVAAAVGGVVATTAERVERVDVARASWGEERWVLISAVDHAAGDELIVERRRVPAAMVADGAIDDDRIDDLIARQAIGEGEMVHRFDVVAPSGPQARTPRGYLAVPVVESPRSGALAGDRVRVVSEGIVLSGDAVVVGGHDDVTLVAVPEAEAALVPAAADVGRVTLLLVP